MIDEKIGSIQNYLLHFDHNIRTKQISLLFDYSHNMAYIKQDFNFWERGAFFAFWQDQFDRQKKEWVEYVSADYWLFLPKETARQILEDFKAHNESERQRRIQEDWLKNIILYELNNHECYVTMLYWFSCEREIKAWSPELAKEYAEKHCWCFSPQYQSSLPQDDVNWNWDVHPIKSSFISISQ